MKKLILIRHAKSSWEYDVIDHQRPLKERGYKDAALVSKALQKLNLNIDLVLCSDAVRTRMTSEIFISELNINPEIVKLNHDLYDFSGNDLIRTIKSCDTTVNTLMVFGHNHAITDFVNTYGSTFIDNVPTSGVVIIEFNIDNWNALKPGITQNTFFPRNFK
ncbi:SixA phosphatase family protein [Algibacter luteus]|uniref:SixA phosphatase family protein n=1 Tax=Algibacter luteus TaxID=1178825 RepID=UPI0025966761|nr:histidine phosphatase family protein [Algibacter luteus]WJJ95351.1 histidine phosphatase family protein [Algibacter luteus]